MWLSPFPAPPAVETRPSSWGRKRAGTITPGGDPPIRIRRLILPALAAASAAFALVLLCLIGVVWFPGGDETVGTDLTYVRGRGYAVAVFRDRTGLRTSVPLTVPPLGPWVPGALDVDAWVRSRRQTWREHRVLGFRSFSGEIVMTGLAQHPFLPDAGVTRIRHYDMDHAVAVPHWASLLGSVALPALWWRRRRRETRQTGFELRTLS